ncbi:hypothetical protein, partial [Clostridioides difficile]|uniref:hypothetical protein n=1 Tax=Clostridioides difficile TaxID=1496 RepID=UPI002A9115ED
ICILLREEGQSTPTATHSSRDIPDSSRAFAIVNHLSYLSSILIIFQSSKITTVIYETDAEKLKIIRS